MLRSKPIVIAALLTYVFLMLLGLVFSPVLGFWPYLFLLSTQKITGGPEPVQMIVAMVLGALPVGLVAWIRQNSVGEGLPEDTQGRIQAGLAMVVLSLAGVILLAFLVALIFGWPTGV